MSDGRVTTDTQDVQYFTTPGYHSWDRPFNARSVRVELVGGGGASSSSRDPSPGDPGQAGHGGGGGGALFSGEIPIQDIDDQGSPNIYVGAGGSYLGSPAGNGMGDPSTFAGFQAQGGLGGAAGGAGGTFTSELTPFVGYNGSSGQAPSGLTGGSGGHVGAIPASPYIDPSSCGRGATGTDALTLTSDITQCVAVNASVGSSFTYNLPSDIPDSSLLITLVTMHDTNQGPDQNDDLGGVFTYSVGAVPVYGWGLYSRMAGRADQGRAITLHWSTGGSVGPVTVLTTVITNATQDPSTQVVYGFDQRVNGTMGASSQTYTINPTKPNGVVWAYVIGYEAGAVVTSSGWTLKGSNGGTGGITATVTASSDRSTGSRSVAFTTTGTFDVNNKPVQTVLLTVAPVLTQPGDDGLPGAVAVITTLDPIGPDRAPVIATDSATAYRTVDDGLSWHELTGYPGDANYAFVWDGRLVLLQRWTVMESPDNGVSWRFRRDPAINGPYSYMYAAYLSPSGTLLVAADGVYRSTDGGLTFTTQLSGMYVSTLLYLGSGIWLCGSSSGLLRSVDDGLTWTGVSSATTPGYAVAGTASNCIAVGYGPYDAHQSFDAGATWTLMSPQPVASPWSLVGGMLVYGNGVYLATSSGPSALHRSTDGGATWTGLPLSATGGSQTSLWFHGGVFYMVRTLSGGGGLPTVSGVYRSTDNGTTWPEMVFPHMHGVNSEYSHQINYLTFTVDRLFISGNYTWMSTDGGATFDLVFSRAVVAPSVIGDHWMVAGSQGVHHSDDGGVTWSRKPFGDPYDHNQYPWAMVTRSGTSIIVTRQSPGFSTFKVFRSTDQETWADRTPSTWRPMNFTPYILEYGDGRWMVTDRDRISYSDDDGLTWSEPAYIIINGVDCSPDFLASGGKTWVSATNGTLDFSSPYGFQLILSEDRGTTWTAQPTYTDYYGGHAAAAGEGQFIAGDGNSILRSKDGKTWTSEPNDYPVSPWALCRLPTGVWLIAGDSYQYRSTDDGATWTRTDWNYLNAAWLEYLPNYGGHVGSAVIQRYLRMTQRDDSLGIQRAPRLVGPGINQPTSRALGKPRRLGDSNTYL